MIHLFRTNNETSLWCLYSLVSLFWISLNIFHNFFGVSVVDFGQINACWALIQSPNSCA